MISQAFLGIILAVIQGGYQLAAVLTPLIVLFHGDLTGDEQQALAELILNDARVRQALADAGHTAS